MATIERWQIIRLVEMLKAGHLAFELFLVHWNEEINENLVYTLKRDGRIIRLLTPIQRADMQQSWVDRHLSVVGYQDTEGLTCLVFSDILPKDMLENKVNQHYGTLIQSNCDAGAIK